jgi:Xaa-Pro aminopeptidase
LLVLKRQKQKESWLNYFRDHSANLAIFDGKVFHLQEVMSSRILAILFFSLSAVSMSGQVGYDADLLPPSFHFARREALREKMEPNSVAFIFSAPVRNRSNDVEFQYSQDPNFFYLTGLNEPNALLILFKEQQDFDTVTTSELIYVQPRDPSAESWRGKRLGAAGVKKNLGFYCVYNNTSFYDLKINFSKFSKVYHSKQYNDVRDDKQDEGDLFSMLKVFNERTAAVTDKKNTFAFSLFMSELREIKTGEEMTLMRKAIRISCDAHQELMRCLEPGMTEYQAQALVEFGFKFNGSEYVGYPTIAGAGPNSCILHYISNRKKFVNKDLIVVDAGAEYHGYTADITRTLPVSGKFSEEQKKIYNIVLDAQLAAIKACKKGNNFRDPHNEAVDVIKKELEKLGIISEPADFVKYFFHGTSHYLGMDVHDPGSFLKLRPGQVITVEPGIYIPEGSPCDKKWWNIGVRIEDDVLITEDEPDVLSGKLPKTVSEIEKTMSEAGFLKKN